MGRKEEVKEVYKFSGKGEIYSFTRVFETMSGYEGQTPYWIALIKLNEGPMVTAQLTDFWGENRPEIGMKVERVTRVLSKQGDKGVIIYGDKYRQPLEK